ncbi:hypothetical protein BRC90_10075 [Halobacteriales archaeon QS_4_69_34]|nr:MAG: hypothetical protein BRC90_10075 [Halobacteriales archaeon QS_4_69_34]
MTCKSHLRNNLVTRIKSFRIMDSSDVQAYVERSRVQLEADPQMSEQNTKTKLIDPLIRLLGWDLYSSEVELEYSLQIGTRNPRVDYALLLNNTPEVFIEVKSSGVRIKNKHLNQSGSYMRQEGVRWGLLTNGRRFQVLRSYNDGGKPGENLLADIKLEDVYDEWQLLSCISKSQIQSGEADERADGILKRKTAIEDLKSNKEEIVGAVVETVTSNIVDTLLGSTLLVSQSTSRRACSSASLPGLR